MGGGPGQSSHAMEMRAWLVGRGKTTTEGLIGWELGALNNLLSNILEESNEEFL